MSTDVESPSIALAEYLSDLRYEDIPEDVIVHAKRIVTNIVGATLWGWHTPGGAQVFDVFNQLAGADDCVVIGSADRMPPPLAAGVHAAMAFATMSDDTHGPAQIHIGHAVVPAILAVGETRSMSGKEFLTALVGAIEVGVRIGMAVGPGQDVERNSVKMGFWSDVKCSLAAAAAACRAYSMPSEEIVHALGIAATSSSGLVAISGYGKPPHASGAGSVFAWDAAKATSMGVLAAQLAQSGMTTAAQPLESDRGWVRTYARGGGSIEALTAGLGVTFETSAVALKAHCMSHTVFPVVEAAGELMQENDVNVDDIVSVAVHGPQYVYDTVWRTKIESFNDAVCSGPFAIGLNMISPADFTYADKVVAHLNDPTLTELMGKFRFELDSNIEMSSGQLPGSITIELKDGTFLHKHSRPASAGSYPEYPLRETLIVDKFRAGAAGLLSPDNVDSAVEMMMNLETLDDIGTLTAALAGIRN